MKRTNNKLLASFLCIIFFGINVNVFANYDIPTITIDPNITHTQIKMYINVTIHEDIDGTDTIVTNYKQTASSDGYLDISSYEEKTKEMQQKHDTLIKSLRQIGSVIKDDANTMLIEERTENIIQNSGYTYSHKYETYIMTYDVEVQYNPIHAIKTYTEADNYETISLIGGQATEVGDYSAFDGKYFKRSGSHSEEFMLSVNYDEKTNISTLSADIPQNVQDGEYYIDEDYLKTDETNIYNKSTFEEITISQLPAFIDQYTQRTDEFVKEARYTRIHTSVITAPDKPTLSVDGTYTYNGTEQTAKVIGYDPEKMNIRNNVQTKAGTYKIFVSPKMGKWSDNTADTVKITWTIAKATPVGTPKYTPITSEGKTLADAAITAEASAFNVSGTVKWITNDGADIADTTVVNANTYYKWLFIPTDTDNYETLTGETKLYSRSSGSNRGTSTSTYTVSFETNGGSKISSEHVQKNTVLKEPAAPTKESFDFAGWYTDKELKTKYDFSAKVTRSMTLYAAWTEKKTDNSENQIILTIGKKGASVFGKVKTNDVAPRIVNDRAMLPARFVAENLGAFVEWDGDKQLVTIMGKNLKTNEDVTIFITIGAEYAVVNGENVKLDSPAFIENDRTYTPIRFISEHLGASVEWLENEQKVIITKNLLAEKNN